MIEQTSGEGCSTSAVTLTGVWALSFFSYATWIGFPAGRQENIHRTILERSVPAIPTTYP